MDSIKVILDSILESVSKKKEDVSRKAVLMWPTIVDELVARHTKAMRMHKTTLWVAVDDATWAYELSQKYKRKIIHQCNTALGEKAITDIHFVIGDIRD